MKKYLYFLVLFTLEAHALQAVVTVLEAPLFKDKSYTSPVVQYLRKGDIINIDSSLENDRTIEQYAPSPEKIKNYQDQNTDPFFEGENKNIASIEDTFIPTVDRQGHIVYILSEHIYIYFNNAREYEQKISSKDPTDYRLEEPLPPKYPFKTLSGLRGQFLLGFNQPYSESYEYRSSIKSKGYSSPVDLSYSILKQATGNYQERLFLGGTLNFKYFKNSYLFFDNRTSTEQSIKLGVGPTISYDAFKGEKNRINLSGTISFNFFNRLYITQTLKDEKDARTYAAYSLAPRISIQYHRKKIINDLDFILGTMMEIETVSTFNAKNAGKQESWWKNLGNDKFMTRTVFALGGFLGIQTAY
jgi:hypothetical protein